MAQLEIKAWDVKGKKGNENVAIEGRKNIVAVHKSKKNAVNWFFRIGNIMGKYIFLMILLIFACLYNSKLYGLGYVSRDCPSAGAMESFTMSWTSQQWMITRAFLPKKTLSGYRWQKFESSKLVGDWDYKYRSAAGIHPWTSISTDNYYRAVYGFHYWYNQKKYKVEKRAKMIHNSCDVLNWGVNNWS